MINSTAIKIRAYHGMTTGEICEDTFVDALTRHYPDVRGIVNCTGTAKDKLQGTDYEVFGVPTDITSYFDGKDHMDELPGSIPLRDDRQAIIATIRFGFRTGNSHVSFAKPVLVIGIDSNPRKWRSIGYVNLVSNALNRQMKTIIDHGQDEFWQKCDALGYDF